MKKAPLLTALRLAAAAYKAAAAERAITHTTALFDEANRVEVLNELIGIIDRKTQKEINDFTGVMEQPRFAKPQTLFK